MNSTVKEILSWILILVAAVGLYTLVAKGVIVRIIPPDRNPWSALLLSWGLPLLFVFGSQCILTWCLYRAILSHLPRPPNGNAT